MIFETLAEACKDLTERGFEFVPLYYASERPNHADGFWVGHGVAVGCAQSERGYYVTWAL